MHTYAPTHQPLQALIIEDDQDHRDLLVLLLKKNCPNVHVTDWARNIKEAIDLLSTGTYDLVFMDVNLGEEYAFDIIKNTPFLSEKQVVIVSSHREYALEAFKFVATDYILKPVTSDSLVDSVTKVQNNIYLQRIASEKNNTIVNGKPLKRIAIPSLSDVSIIAVDDLLYLQSEGRYTKFYLTDGTTKLASKNLGEYEKLFAHNNFYRVHHSYLVNMDFALNIHKTDGNYMELPNRVHIPISKRKLDGLYQFLNIK